MDDAEASADASRALLTAAIDDLLRLCITIRTGDIAAAASDATVLLRNWAWPIGINTFSDGSFIAASTTPPRISLPPHHRRRP